MKMHTSKISDAELRHADEVLAAPSDRPTATESVIRYKKRTAFTDPSDTPIDIPDTYTIVGLYDSPDQRKIFIDRCHAVRCVGSE